MTKKADIEPGLLNKNQMATSCGLSRQAFDKWGVEPYKSIGNQKLYRVQDVLKNRLDRIQKKNDNYDNLNPDEYDDAGVINPVLEDAMLKREMRIAAQLKNQVLEGRLLPANLASAVITKVLAQVGATFDALPLQIKRLHPDIPQSAIDAIKREIVEYQNEAANAGQYVESYIDEFIEQAEASIK
jgi:phage terminase Nu1 subunit (DNA packaging protein)